MKTSLRFIVSLAAFAASIQAAVLIDIEDREQTATISLVGKIIEREQQETSVELPQPLVHLDFTNAAGTKQASGSEQTVFTFNGVGVVEDTVDFGTAYSTDHFVESTETFAALQDADTFTLTIWLNPASLAAGSGGNRIVSTSRIHPASGIDLVHEDDGQLVLGISQWPDQSTLKSSAKLKLGVWNFVAVVKTASTVTFHVIPEGTPFGPDASHSFTKPVNDSGGKLTLGHFEESYRSQGSDRMFRGKMKDFRLWKEALDEEKLRFVMTGNAHSAPFEVVIDEETKLFKRGSTNEFHTSFDTRGTRLWVIYESTELGSWEPLYAGEGEYEKLNFVLQSTNRQEFLKIE